MWKIVGKFVRCFNFSYDVLDYRVNICVCRKYLLGFVLYRTLSCEICARWLRYHAPWRMMCSPSGALYRAPHYRGIAITFGDIRGWSRGFRRNLLRAGIHAHKSPGLSGFEWFAEENQQYCLYFRRSWFLLCSSGGTLGWAKNRKLLVLFKPKILAFIKIAFEFDYRIIGCKNGSQ